jgi:predicted SAM-dependent methyltransferase
MNRETIPFNNSGVGPDKRLNIGCGRHYHPAWVNLDLQSDDPNVICHNVTHGIPFSDSHFDNVYHSHILEHLDPERGQELIGECFRVLKPGGIMRVVVPDLEEIAQLYLAMHDQAWEGNDLAQVNYHWMKMELLDQMVRSQSGGLMGPYMAEVQEDKAEFVQSRIGSEYHLCRAPDVDPRDEQLTLSVWESVCSSLRGIKASLARKVVRMLMGESAEQAFEESLFRGQGEVHRWMYDRYSLRELCLKEGFVDFQVSTAFESQIEGYNEFQLDSVGQEIRKPDSLFIECRKPGIAMRASA